MSRLELSRLLRPAARFLGQTADRLLLFLGRHCTPLAVVALTIAGGTVIFITCYLTRYSGWNWWRWKRRAAVRTACLGMALAALKTILGAM